MSYTLLQVQDARRSEERNVVRMADVRAAPSAELTVELLRPGQPGYCKHTFAFSPEEWAEVQAIIRRMRPVKSAWLPGGGGMTMEALRAVPVLSLMYGSGGFVLAYGEKKSWWQRESEAAELSHLRPKDDFSFYLSDADYDAFYAMPKVRAAVQLLEALTAQTAK